MSTVLSADDLQSHPLSRTPVFSRPTWAQINLEALSSNARALHRATGVPLLGVIKADAYGHGAAPVARALLAQKCVQMLAVASVDEGIQLRADGIVAPLLLLSAMLTDEAEAVVEARLTPTVCSIEMAHAVSVAAQKAKCVAPIHFKIDTGMARLGARPEETAPLLCRVLSLPSLRVEGIYTHLACADEEEDCMTARQLQIFEEALNSCRALLREYSVPPVCAHSANSAAALRYQSARFDYIRPGLALYGVSPFAQKPEIGPELQPVMSFCSQVARVCKVPTGMAVSYGATWRASRPSCIATVPVGYADGYRRCLSNRAQVLVAGQRCPVVGRITMDQILVDCTNLEPTARVGDPVVLWGKGLPVEEVARRAETIPYELLCGVSRRVPRVYERVYDEGGT